MDDDLARRLDAARAERDRRLEAFRADRLSEHHLDAALLQLRFGEEAMARKTLELFAAARMREEGMEARLHVKPPKPDAPPPGWKDLDQRVPVAPWKTRVTMRVDSDVLKWFRKMGPGYQTRMNAVLRAYWEAKKGR